MKSKIFLVGRIGSDAETRQVGESKVTSFNFVTSKTWKNKKGEKQEKSSWFKCNLWNRESLQKHLTKGTVLTIEGEEIKANAYTDKNGNPQASVEVTVSDLTFLPNGAKAETKVDLSPNIDDDFNF